VYASAEAREVRGDVRGVVFQQDGGVEDGEDDEKIGVGLYGRGRWRRGRVYRRMKRVEKGRGTVPALTKTPLTTHATATYIGTAE